MELFNDLFQASQRNRGTPLTTFCCRIPTSCSKPPPVRLPGLMQGREVASCAPTRPVMAQCGIYPNSDSSDTPPRLENRSWLRGSSGPCPSAVPRHRPPVPQPRGRSRLPASAERDRPRSREPREQWNDSDGSYTRHSVTVGAIRSDGIRPPFAKPIVQRVRQPLRDKSEPEDPDYWASTHYATAAVPLALESICLSQSWLPIKIQRA